MLQAGWDSRTALRVRLQGEGTNCFRVLHAPGLTADAYAGLLLVQCSRHLFQEGGEHLEEWANAHGFTGAVVWERADRTSRVAWQSGDLEPRWVEEFGLHYRVEALPRRLDPQLFLDTRVLRRRLLTGVVKGARLVNLFCYSGSLAIAAHRGGCVEVVQSDFSRSAVARARENAERNGFQQTFVCEEVYPVLWQWAGRPVKRHGRDYVRLKKRDFDVIVLDPPQRSRGFFGSVDIKNDYSGLFRPCLEMLAAGGRIFATNNLAEVTLEQFLETLERSSRKAGRPWSSHQVHLPEEDFPTHDGRPPLKMVELVW